MKPRTSCWNHCGYRSRKLTSVGREEGVCTLVQIRTKSGIRDLISPTASCLVALLLEDLGHGGNQKQPILDVRPMDLREANFKEEPVGFLKDSFWEFPFG